jgi:hypothetical protein
MLGRAVLSGLIGATMLLGASVESGAVTADPALGSPVAQTSDITNVRWVCGPYRCAYVPGYVGPVVVRPYMRRWAPPPHPHCNYVRGPRGRWALVCP